MPTGEHAQTTTSRAASGVMAWPLTPYGYTHGSLTTLGRRSRNLPRRRCTRLRARQTVPAPLPRAGRERPVSDPHILLPGDRLALGMPRQDMLPEYHAWENDPRTLLGYGNQTPQAWEGRAAGWERQRSNSNYQQFEIVRLADSAAIGITILQINLYVRTAEFVIVLAPAERGKGYAAEATRLTLDWAFNLVALRMVWLKVLEPNRAGITAYEKAGFRPAGRLRQSGYWLGQPVDEILMDALPENFTGPSAVAATIDS